MVVLDIWGLLYFHMNFKIVGFFFNFWEELHWSFDVDCIESAVYFQQDSCFHNINAASP